MRRKEQAEASKAGLVEAARQCFTEHGYDATTVAAILDRAGMARGALYHYFPGGKREIFAAVFRTVDDEFHRRRDALFEITSPLARIRAGFRLFLELCVEDDFARIILIDAPDVFPGEADRGSSYELLRAQLKEAAAAGEVHAFQIEVMAVSLYGAIRRAGEFVISAPDRGQAATEAAQALDLMLNGLSLRG
ncbi:helix-turn-helix domain-containing protein [Spirillospora sp. NPDC047279]|uniref:TetR/AcrR family transcriptional regulator n=1 Tax=Spirillospora sp. NPDC047279 TaxID=3155478 RepID=UPI0033E1B174